MSRPASDTTLLQQARRDIKDLRLALSAATMASDQYRIRATKAEQECAEWKARFDLLLRVRPETAGPIYRNEPSPSSGDPLPPLPTSICKTEPPCPST